MPLDSCANIDPTTVEPNSPNLITVMKTQKCNKPKSKNTNIQKIFSSADNGGTKPPLEASKHKNTKSTKNTKTPKMLEASKHQPIYAAPSTLHFQQPAISD